jgi:hypothetical protein
MIYSIDLTMVSLFVKEVGLEVKKRQLCFKGFCIRQSDTLINQYGFDMRIEFG